MAKAVFILNPNSIYNDEHGLRYQFPTNRYLKLIEKTVGDWVVFYSSVEQSNLGYHSIQMVKNIVPDPSDPGRSYALLDQKTLFSLENSVGRQRPDGTLFETGLPLTGGSNASAVRLISDEDFFSIVEAELRNPFDQYSIPRVDDVERANHAGFSDNEQAHYEVPVFSGQDRQSVLVSRKVRDASFARQVKRAYGARCAFSGLELRNGGGRPEVEAAHIKPVSEDGPDVVQNGLALSGTVHWMFDRGLISVDDNNSLLISEGSIAAEVADRLFLPERQLIMPDNAFLRPHPSYTKWHREHCFKG